MVYLCGMLSEVPSLEELIVDIRDGDEDWEWEWCRGGCTAFRSLPKSFLSFEAGLRNDFYSGRIARDTTFYLQSLALLKAKKCDILLPNSLKISPGISDLKTQYEKSITGLQTEYRHAETMRKRYLAILDEKARLRKRQKEAKHNQRSD